MKSLGKVIIAFFQVSLILLICSCNNYSNCNAEIIRDFNIDKLAGVTEDKDKLYINVNNYTTINLDYKVKNGEPNELMVVKICFKTNDSYKNLISVNTAENYDVNGNRTKSVIKQNSEHLEISHILKLDSKGESAFSISIGNDSNKFRGNIEFEQPKILDVYEDSDLKVIDSEDNMVSLIMYQSDFSNLDITVEKCIEIAEKLAEMRVYIKDFVAATEDEKIQYVFIENIDYTGLSGELIYINNEEIYDLFTKRNYEDDKKDSFISILCHEMSHKFDNTDEIGNTSEYCFNKEFFTVLREMYALDLCGFDISVDFLGDNKYLKNGIYNYQDFLNCYLSGLDIFDNPDNWDYVSKILIDLSQISSKMTDGEKMYRFIKYTSYVSGIDINDLIGESEWKTVCKYFSVDY